MSPGRPDLRTSHGAARPWAIAHRGDPCHHRENTLPSLRSAVAAGADAVEIDVRTTADGVAIVLHDATLERLWGHDREPAGLPAAEVRRLTGGGVPSLREALAVTAATRTLIDLPDASAAHSAVTEVHECGAAGRVYYCGGPAAMRAVRAADPAAEIALTWKRTAPPRASLLAEVRPRWLSYRFGLLREELVRRAHEEGYLVGCWTVDTVRTMRRLAALGIDAITTNRIGTLRRCLRAPAAAVPEPLGPEPRGPEPLGPEPLRRKSWPEPRPGFSREPLRRGSGAARGVTARSSRA